MSNSHLQDEPVTFFVKLHGILLGVNATLTNKLHAWLGNLSGVYISALLPEVVKFDRGHAGVFV